MGREGRDYWEAQLSEYWDSGLTIQEYSELKELPYERIFLNIEATRQNSWLRIASDTLRQRLRIHTFFACGILSANVWNVRGRWKVGNDGLPAAGVKC